MDLHIKYGTNFKESSYWTQEIIMSYTFSKSGMSYSDIIILVKLCLMCNCRVLTCRVLALIPSESIFGLWSSALHAKRRKRCLISCHVLISWMDLRTWFSGHPYTIAPAGQLYTPCITFTGSPSFTKDNDIRSDTKVVFFRWTSENHIITVATWSCASIWTSSKLTSYCLRSIYYTCCTP